MRPGRLLSVPFLASAVFCSTPAAETAPQPSAAAPKPTLVVLITVDQMRRDYFDRWTSQLTSGLKRLSGGAFFSDAHQDHAITETAPGHASLLSGRFPRSTGITRNVAGVNDNTPLLGGAPGLGASPARFRGSALFDWMAKVTPQSRALSVSYKDRGAILPVGRSKQEVYWYSVNGTYTTSKWYRDSLPTWVQNFNNRRLPQSYAGKTWDLLLPASSYSEPDSVPVERNGRNFLFPHPLSGNLDTLTSQLPGYPFMDEVSVALALAGVNALGLGKGPAPDLLAVSLSSTDLVGHTYGSDSREIHDQILRLDRTIGMFIDSLFKLRDSNQVAIVLTADHGAQPYPELNNGRINPPPQRADFRPALALLRKMITDSGGSPRAFDFESGALFLDKDSIKVSSRWANIAIDSFIATAGRSPGVAQVDRLSDLAKRDLGKDMIARRWVQMFPPDVPVVATVTMTPGSYWATIPPGVGMHGSPNLQDSNVPIVFYGPWFKPGRYGEFVRTVDIAPTLAQVLGIPPLEPIDGRVLKAAIR